MNHLEFIFHFYFYSIPLQFSFRNEKYDVLLKKNIITGKKDNSPFEKNTKNLNPHLFDTILAETKIYTNSKIIGEKNNSFILTINSNKQYFIPIDIPVREAYCRFLDLDIKDYVISLRNESLLAIRYLKTFEKLIKVNEKHFHYPEHECIVEFNENGKHIIPITTDNDYDLIRKITQVRRKYSNSTAPINLEINSDKPVIVTDFFNQQ